MENGAPSGYVVPNVRIPKVVGILNIVFASAILICGLCMGVYVMILPSFGKAVVGMQKKMEQTLEDQKKAELNQLDEEEKAAETAEQKAIIRERRAEINERPKPSMNVTS